MSQYARENLLRLMADQGLSLRQAADKTGLDQRTIRGILRGSNQPHARTLHRLAAGLGVKVDEFFVDPSQLLYRCFDRQTNPLVQEVLETHQRLFAGWTEADFDELHSHVGAGGALTREGTLLTVRHMNRKRLLHDRLDVLLESTHAKLVSRMIDMFYKDVVKEKEPVATESGSEPSSQGNESRKPERYRKPERESSR
jgi:transcriptional regulator with XRE-family HTH domain